MIWWILGGFDGVCATLLCEILSENKSFEKIKNWIVSLSSVAGSWNLRERYYHEMPVFNVAGSEMSARYYQEMKVLKRLDL